jgi:hypothetical protein
MSDAVLKAAVLFTFGALALFYCLTLAVFASSFGSAIGVAFTERAVAISIAARTVGAMLPVLIVAFTLWGRSKFRTVSVLSWVLMLD